MKRQNTNIRNLIVVLGDQLDAESPALAGCDPSLDAIWMAEVAAESTKVWSGKPRIAVFLSAMRHFRDRLRGQGWRVFYREMTVNGGEWRGADGSIKDAPGTNFAEVLVESLRTLRPEKARMVEAGEWAVDRDIRAAFSASGVPIEVCEDTHFLCSRAEFTAHAKGRKQLRMEYFYREMRQRHGVLMDEGKPEGGAWNFDSENRKSFGKDGPPFHSLPKRFHPDSTTQEVLSLVEAKFPAHPGSLAGFDWPVTQEEAEAAMEDFIAHRLGGFGDWQDAMWTAEPWLFHSRLSAAMNLKLLNPRKVIAAAEAAYRSGRAPLAAAEGFIRQILGWREYVRGIYWRFMPGYVEMNALGANERLPAFYWTGDTEMACLRDALGQTLRHGYAHHIQRLMVTGLFALLLGVNPREVHEWYLAVYVDAVEWVELPNTLGMSQHGDGGLMASKPYVATGKYIQRMSNYCDGCRFDPAESTGPKACPFTTLYWDFLFRHETLLRGNQRMTMQLKNLTRIRDRHEAIANQAAEFRARFAPAIAPKVPVG
jgi:deoxyribodipyrimidine photolyase-related protein